MPRGLVKRTFHRSAMPVRIGKWPGVLAHFDGAVPFANALCDKERASCALDGLRADAPDEWSDMPHAEVYDPARLQPAAMAITSRRDGTSRFSVKRPLTFTLWAVAVWLRKRADRKEMRNATNQLCVAPDQILEDLGVSRDEMLAKSMCHEDLGEARDETEPDRQ